ncbi:hypothetical protein N39L_22640 [Limnospira platensis NIES-39]|uniref:Uncharacterized protein n=2 Tax=Sirenicapillariaceae TaxID=2934961 RepID=A0A5M3TDG0_LIMPL|nr:hypothetical protein N39L_22640 [Arthrospira platensis NIES-39]GCE96627.1 hypothetical protein NIES46_46990 [Arthrospira platensis NIES-46]
MMTAVTFLWGVTSMPKLLPVINLMSGRFSNFLLGHGGICIDLDTPEWFDYLIKNKSFSVELNGKRFTACKKTSINGFAYWNLKGSDGKINHHIYIGKSDQTTNEKIQQAAIAMFYRCNPKQA